MKECFIYDHQRTPRGIGKPQGKLHAFRPVYLLASILQRLVTRNGFDSASIDDVIIGCVEPHSEQGGNIARAAVLLSGMSETVPGMQINRFCASGLDSNSIAAAKIISGQAEAVIAGGVECMSRVKMGSSSGALFVDPSIVYDHQIIPQGISADLIATREGYSRTDLDAWAVLSQSRARNAWENGYFSDQVAPVSWPTGRVALAHDEHMRSGVTLESLAELKPSFAMMGALAGYDSVIKEKYPDVDQINHVHHPGNSSGIVDGAAVNLLGTKAFGERYGLTPLARIKGFHSTGIDPTIMLTAPSVVSRMLIEKQGLSIRDIDSWEINEAFSSVVLKAINDLSIDESLVNPDGGSIAMGHPLGATGSILLGTLARRLKRNDLNKAVVTLCVAGGMGSAMLIDNGVG
ncbi:MAG: acetyl-CoA acetyltransferase [Legionellales bacterium]|nr:acetyl-CoA acetyltransferase [Legionellales bacterium]